METSYEELYFRRQVPNCRLLRPRHPSVRRSRPDWHDPRRGSDREGDGGNAATETTVCTKGIFDLSVKGVNAGGNAAVTVGAKVYYDTATTPKLGINASKVPFGYALEAIDSGATATIKVLVK